MEYYAKSRKKILSQGEIDKVRAELENLIIKMNWLSSFFSVPKKDIPEIT